MYDENVATGTPTMATMFVKNFSKCLPLIIHVGTKMVSQSSAADQVIPARTAPVSLVGVNKMCADAASATYFFVNVKVAHSSRLRAPPMRGK